MSNEDKHIISEVNPSPKLKDSLKADTSTHKMMQEINKSIRKIPDFNISGNFSLDQSSTTPTHEQVNEYQSASVFMKAIADEAMVWKKQLPSNFRPAILAFLYGGVQIHVHSLSQVSFHGIRIEGRLDDRPCSLLAHQSTVQMLCYGEEQNKEKPSNPIGFLWENNSVEI